MATLVRHKGGIFYIVTSLNGKRVWRSLRTRDRKEAYRIYLADNPTTPTPKTLTMKEAQAEFLSYALTNFSPKTAGVYRNVFNNLNEFIGTRPLNEISPRDIEVYKNTRVTKVSPCTVNQDIRSLRAFFNRLKLWKILDQNPLDGVKQIKVADTIRPYLLKEELEILLRHTQGTSLHDLILFAAMTGLRRGEVLNLSWDDINLINGTVLVRSSLSFNTKGGKIRHLPLNSSVRRMLESMPVKSGLLFPGERGGKNNGDFVSKRFKAAIKACGLDPRLHFHSLRHTFASLLVKEGVSLYHVQRLLGHSTSRVTEIYAHLGSSELLGSVEKLCA